MTWSWSRPSLLGWAAAALLLFTSGDVPLSNGPFTYHVSADGDDTASGLNPKSAWRSLARVNEEVLEPGDTILLTGGRHLEGTLILSWEDAGDPSNPVRIIADASFPGIAATGKAGIELADVSGVLIEGVDVLVRKQESTDGVLMYSTRGSGGHHGITIRDSEIHGAKNGIALDASAPGDGFHQVVIERVSVLDSLRNGIISYGPEAPDYAHQDLRVSDSFVADTRGIAGISTNSGSGIVLGSVDGAVVERSEATRNGRDSDAEEGPVGIWAHDARQVVFRDNLAHSNRTRVADGGGFGFDVGTIDSLMERNLSHSNSGPGFMVLTHEGGETTGRNTLRYNASAGDAQFSSYHGGISLIGGFTRDIDEVRVFDTHIHHNTVLTYGDSGAAPLQMMGNLENIQIHHNIFDSSGGWATPVHSRMMNPSSTVSFFANHLWKSPSYSAPLFFLDGYPAYSFEELHGIISRAYWNFEAPVAFTDRFSFPSGLTPEDILYIETEVPLESEPAEKDLLGNPVEFPNRAIGAISARGSARNSRYQRTYLPR